jgi:acyl-CoA hydrolase
MICKTVSHSITQHTQILLPRHVNGSNHLFGGQLMSWIDTVAAVVARRHSNLDVTTASVDHLIFEGPAPVNSLLVMEGRITHTGRTSMEIRVDTYTEAPDGIRTRINRAYLIMVALDALHKPAQVPALVLETPEDHMEWEQALRRREARKGYRIS